MKVSYRDKATDNINDTSKTKGMIYTMYKWPYYKWPPWDETMCDAQPHVNEWALKWLNLITAPDSIATNSVQACDKQPGN